MPRLRRALRGDVVLVGLVEEMDDGLVAVEDVLPVATGELRLEVHHWAVRCPATELRWGPCVPIADGGHGAVEVALVHCPWDTRVAGTGGVGPVPEETALLDYHGGYIDEIVVIKGLLSGSSNWVGAAKFCVVRARLNLLDERCKHGMKK